MLWRAVFLAAITTAAAPAHAESNRMKAARAALAEWERCVITISREYASQAEPADTLVDAAFGRCLTYRNDYVEKVQKVSRGPLPWISQGAPYGEIEDFADDVGRKIRTKAIAAILETRAAPRAAPATSAAPPATKSKISN